MRTRKIAGSKTYEYYWFDSQLAMMTITSASSVMTLKFYYDANGLPIIFDYNGTQYYYITNLQGDVVGLANEYGIVATYVYDAFGKGNEDMEDTVHDVYVVLPQVESKLGVNGSIIISPSLRIT